MRQAARGGDVTAGCEDGLVLTREEATGHRGGSGRAEGEGV